MKAEQTNSARFYLTSSDVIEVQITIHFQLLTDDESDVWIHLSYEPEIFPNDWQAQDAFHQKLYNGIHAGLASVNLPRPSTCLAFDITRINILPPLEIGKIEDRARIGNLLAEMVRWTSASLWSGSEALKEKHEKP